MLTTSESRLNLKLPDAYRWFLVNFGQGGIGGVEVLGVGKNGKLSFVDETIKYRSYGLPKDVILIEKRMGVLHSSSEWQSRNVVSR